MQDFTDAELAAVKAALIVYRADLDEVDKSKSVDWEIKLHDEVRAAAESAFVKVDAEVKKMWGRS